MEEDKAIIKRAANWFWVVMWWIEISINVIPYKVIIHLYMFSFECGILDYWLFLFLKYYLSRVERVKLELCQSLQEVVWAIYLLCQSFMFGFGERLSYCWLFLNMPGWIKRTYWAKNMEIARYFALISCKPYLTTNAKLQNTK